MTRKQNYFGQIILTADLVVVIGCYWAAYCARVWIWQSGYPVLPIGRATVNSWIIILAFAACVIVSRYFGLYIPVSYRSISRVLATSFKAQALEAVLVLNTIFVLRGFSGVSRPLLAFFVLIRLLSSSVERLTIVFVLRYGGRLQRRATAWRVLLVGNPEEAESYLNLVREHPEWNLQIVGIVSATENNPSQRVGGELYSTTEQ